MTDAVGPVRRMRLLALPGWLALAAGLLVLLAIVGASLGLSVLNRDQLTRLRELEQTRFELAAISRGLTRAESAQRGYLLTGQATYLAPYHDAVATLPAALDALGARLRQSPVSRALFPELRETADVKLRELASTVALERGGAHQAALALVETDAGRTAKLRFDVLITRMADEQASLTRREIASNHVASGLLIMVDCGGLACLLLLAVFVGREISRTLIVLQHAERELGTANERLHEEVAVRTADLLAANEEIQRFAYIVSHDLRAPLVNIMGFTGELDLALGGVRAWLAGGAVTPVPEELAVAVREDAPEAIRFIRASTGKMDRLISAILRLSREGRRVLTPERLDLAALLAGVADTLGHQAQAQGATIELGPLPGIVSDRLAIEQVFGNLLENALKYHAPGRPCRIRVTGALDGRQVVLSVEDNGRGIAERDRERVFELFRRAGDQNVPGEGIGLAHVRALVRRLGGSIDCDSVPDMGSVFHVRLPPVILAGAAQRRDLTPADVERTA